MKKLHRELLEDLHRHSEFKIVSIDGHMKICHALLGQTSRYATRQIKNEMPLKNSESINAVLTMKTMSGAVAMMKPSHTESAEQWQSEFRSEIPANCRKQIEHIAVDNPSRKLLLALREVTNSEIQMSMDPIHLAIAYDSVAVTKTKSNRPKGINFSPRKMGLL